MPSFTLSLNFDSCSGTEVQNIRAEMYKFTGHINKGKVVLVRKYLDGTCSALVVMRAPRRHATGAHFDPNVCPPAPPPKKPGKTLLYAMGFAVITGTAIVYAKNSPDARNWLQSNIPLANRVIEVAFQENTTYWKFTVDQFGKVTTAMSQFLFGKEGVSPPEMKYRYNQDLNADAKEAFAPKTYQLPPATLQPLYYEEIVVGTPEVDTPATLIQTDKCVPESPPVVNITRNMVELEKEMHENTRAAIDTFKQATKLCHEYNLALYNIVESSYEDLDKTAFSTFAGAVTLRDKSEKLARETAAKARYALDTLDKMLKEGIEAPPETVTTTKRYIRDFRADLADAEKKFEEEKERSVLSDKYWKQVDEARKTFRQELVLLFPGVDLGARQLELRGDTDLLLLYMLKQVAYLQNEIAELQTLREQKIAKAIACMDEKLITDAKIDDEIKKIQLEKDKEFNKKALELQAQAARNLKEQLKKQYEYQQEAMQYALKRKEAEVLAKFNRMVYEKVEQERVVFKRDLAAMAGKMQAIEQSLKQRAAAEAEARRSQSLWAAAEALLATTRRAGCTAKVDNELKALEKAGKDDRLVQTVLKGIPKEVREGGIATEKALRDRFDTLEATATKVALVGRGGARLPVYFLSWLQSKLLFPSLAEIPKDELENLPTDFANLDTFDIIQRARYFMDHGNLGAALRYVNLLQGAPRAAATHWLQAARAHLELRQAAETVMAHASVSGLLYL